MAWAACVLRSLKPAYKGNARARQTAHRAYKQLQLRQQWRHATAAPDCGMKVARADRAENPILHGRAGGRAAAAMGKWLDPAQICQDSLTNSSFWRRSGEVPGASPFCKVKPT